MEDISGIPLFIRNRNGKIGIFNCRNHDTGIQFPWRKVPVPVIARFYGITIRMYLQQSEHNPPHIHAIYNEDAAAIDFMSGQVLDGYLPKKAVKLVQEWIALHRKELKEIWDTQEFHKLPPLE